MISDLMRDAAVSNFSDWAKYALAGLGLVAFVGIYYVGDYLYGDRELEAEAAPTATDRSPEGAGN